MSASPFVGISAGPAPGTGRLALPLHAVAQTYVRAIRAAGGLPVLLPPVFGAEQAGRLLARLDGLLLSGGGDVAAESYGGEESALLKDVDRGRDETELALARTALGWGKPLLAICRGVQVLNVAAGGTLYADIAAELPGALSHYPAEDQPPQTSSHVVHLTAGSRLTAILGAERLTVNSFHHQAAKEIGTGLVVSARAPDGVIEGLENPDHPFCVGVQWHPEVTIGCQEGMERLFRALVREAGG